MAPRWLTAKHVRSAELAPRHAALVVFVFTQRRNAARRDQLLQTWLGHDWLTPRGSPVPWRYAFVLGRDGSSGGAAAAAARSSADRSAASATASATSYSLAAGGMLSLYRVIDNYDQLVFKTLELLHFARDALSFDVILKTDDDSIVHVARAWQWLVTNHKETANRETANRETPPNGSRNENDTRVGSRLGAHARTARAASRTGVATRAGVSWAATRPIGHGLLYAGRAQWDSQIIRSNYTSRDLWHPEWYPADFQKWAVDYESIGGDRFPPYCSGAGYFLSSSAVSALLAALPGWHGEVLRIEDVFVGLLARGASLLPTSLGELVQDLPKGVRQEPKQFNGRILVHRVAKPRGAFPWLLDEGGVTETA